MYSLLLFQFLDMDHDRWVVVQRFESGHRMSTDLSDCFSDVCFLIVLDEK